VQLTEQVQRINSKLQASITTLSQAGSSNGNTAAGQNGGPGSGSADGASSGAGAAGTRAKIATMSAEVVDSNPYSRLMALQRMGIVKDYERIRSKTVGSLQSIMLVCLQQEAQRQAISPRMFKLPAQRSKIMYFAAMASATVRLMQQSPWQWELLLHRACCPARHLHLLMY
jgi:hypothetical protein